MPTCHAGRHPLVQISVALPLMTYLSETLRHTEPAVTGGDAAVRAAAAAAVAAVAAGDIEDVDLVPAKGARPTLQAYLTAVLAKSLFNLLITDAVRIGIRRQFSKPHAFNPRLEPLPASTLTVGRMTATATAVSACRIWKCNEPHISLSAGRSSSSLHYHSCDTCLSWQTWLIHEFFHLAYA